MINYRTEESISVETDLIKLDILPTLNNIKSDIFLLAWTTTPWTLPANNGLAVNKNITYSMIETINQYTNKRVNVKRMCMECGINISTSPNNFRYCRKCFYDNNKSKY